MLDILKAIIFGIVEGITEWLPISSTGHLIIMNELLKMNQSDAFIEMFQVVIQLGAILAVVVLYFHSPTKTEKQKMMTWQIWIKVVIGCVPAGVIGLLFDNWIDNVFYHWYVVALMLIIYGVLFIVVENYQKGKEPKATKFSQLSIQMVLIIGVFQMLAMIPGTSRSGATIVGALMVGVSRSLAAEYTFLALRRSIHFSWRSRLCSAPAF